MEKFYVLSEDNRKYGQGLDLWVTNGDVRTFNVEATYDNELDAQLKLAYLCYEHNDQMRMYTAIERMMKLRGLNV